MKYRIVKNGGGSYEVQQKYYLIVWINRWYAESEKDAETRLNKLILENRKPIVIKQFNVKRGKVEL